MTDTQAADLEASETFQLKRPGLSTSRTPPKPRPSDEAARSDGEIVLEGEAWCYTFSPDSMQQA